MTVSVGGIAKIWKVMGDSIESQPITTLPEKVFYAEFSDDAQKVMTVAVDETAKVWQVIDDSSIASEPIAILKRENGLSLPAEFSHDGQKVITYSGNIALIWDVAHQNESFKSDQELIDAARKLVEKEFAKSDHK
jgi:WD40 repeat protein